MRLAAWLLLLAAVPAASKAQAPAASASRDGIHALARLEPATGVVNVGSRPGQRIDEIKVAVGDQVSAGQVLAILEGRSQAEAQVALAEIQKRQMDFQRKARADKIHLERRQFAETHKPKVEAATKVADQLRKLLDKATPLWNAAEALAAVTPADRQKLEDGGRYAELLAKTTQAELDKTLLGVEATLTAEKEKLEDAQLSDDNPEFKLADGQLALAKAALAMTEVRAPRAGKVLDVVARPGEIGSGQLLVMGDVSAMVAVAEVFQSDAPKVKVGGEASVFVVDKVVKGKVTRVGSLVGRNQAANMDPRALKDVRVVKVWVQLDDPQPAASLINMETEVVITPGGGG